MDGSRAGMLDGRLSAAWALVLGLGWPIAFLIATAVEPPPADPGASAPLVVELGGLAFLAAMGGTIVASVNRHPVAALSGVATGLIGAAFSIACPMSGHHGYGLWWFAQIGVILAMLAASFVALAQRPDRGVARVPAAEEDPTAGESTPSAASHTLLDVERQPLGKG
jgi:hypothetical protein